MIKIIIVGSKGRMGQTLITCAVSNPEVRIVGQIDLGGNLPALISKADAVIEFSDHTATAGVAALCAEHKKALVIGTTGHSEAETTQFLKFKSQIPMVWSSNFSTGVTTLCWLTRMAAEILGPAFDLEIVEMHHRLKKDAPSGTAKSLAMILAGVRKLQLDKAARHGRVGIVGERKPDEIGIHSVRGGDIIGDHTVIFATPGERVELTHKATSRETFANGALRAALWAAQQKPGLYGMQDVLGLK
jgi:4-hydroxy-tetrahydrodipicolinate reductase